MRRNVIKYVFAIILQMICLNVFAYDFEVDGIYYKISSTSAKTCMVTYGSSSSNTYSGDVKIPASVTYNSVEYSVTSIGMNAFYKCTSLKHLQIPASVTSMASFVFYECPSLVIEDLATTPQTITSYTFNGLTPVVHVPKGYADAYNSESYWCSMTIVGDMINYVLGDADNNGLVNTADVNFLAKYLLSKNTMYNAYASDVNSDDKIDISDLACLISLLNGKYKTSGTNIYVSTGSSVIPSWGRPGDDPSSAEEGETEF